MKQSMPTRNITAMLIVCCLLLCSCGDRGRLDVAKVYGTVTLDGKPLGKGVVIFTPEAGRGATGLIQPDGRYSLETYKPGDGAVLGKHRVTVVAREELPGQEAARPRSIKPDGPSLIPLFYTDSATSGVSFEVTSGGPHRYDIELSSTAKPAGS